MLSPIFSDDSVIFKRQSSVDELKANYCYHEMDKFFPYIFYDHIISPYVYKCVVVNIIDYVTSNLNLK